MEDITEGPSPRPAQNRGPPLRERGRTVGNHSPRANKGQPASRRLSAVVLHCLLGADRAILWAWPTLLKKPAAAGSGSRRIAASLALLALEGFLLLSAWFRWFPFNQHKGWTVLIAWRASGAALLLMFLWFLAALVFRLAVPVQHPLAARADRGRRRPVQLAGDGNEGGEETAGGGGGD